MVCVNEEMLAYEKAIEGMKVTILGGSNMEDKGKTHAHSDHVGALCNLLTRENNLEIFFFRFFIFTNKLLIGEN